MSPASSFHRQCRLLRTATLIVLAGLALVLFTGMASVRPLSAQLFAQLDDTQFWLIAVINGLPALGYLWALWSVQRALGDLAAGRTFQPTVVGAIRHIGVGVLSGALMEVFVVINLTRWVMDAPGSYLYFNYATVVLGVVGAAMVMLARLVDQARAVQAELDEIL